MPSDVYDVSQVLKYLLLSCYDHCYYYYYYFVLFLSDYFYFLTYFHFVTYFLHFIITYFEERLYLLYIVLASPSMLFLTKQVSTSPQ